MGRLLLLLYKYRASLLFVALEILCIWMITTNHLYLSASFFNTSNSVAANTLQFSNSIKDYFELSEVNKQLLEENANLRKELKSFEQSFYNLEISRIKDPQIVGQYEFQDAEVINNSTRWANNHLTINKGRLNGIASGMGVINQLGIVGKVQTVSEHYAVVASVLHTRLMVSSKVKRTGTICTTNWDGNDPTIAQLKFVPRHVNLLVGDTVVTSGYNAVFPKEIMIGIISEVSLNDDQNFYDINVDLANDYNRVSYVYVVKNKLLNELDSVQMESGMISND